ncbi:MAG: transcription elongation factor GreB [Paraglaciecola sp.]
MGFVEYQVALKTAYTINPNIDVNDEYVRDVALRKQQGLKDPTIHSVSPSSSLAPLNNGSILRQSNSESLFPVVTIKTFPKGIKIIVVQETLLKTNLITREGFEKLREELNYLWREHRPAITKMVAWAASLGDRSDNADYKENKHLLRKIDSRIRFLRKRLEILKVIDYFPQQDGKVFFGAWVEVENDNGETKKFRIVGPDEIYLRKDYISIDSPMARALLKKEVAEQANVSTPDGIKTWHINLIDYAPEG